MIIAREIGAYNTQNQKSGPFLKVNFLTRYHMANMGNQKQKLLYIMEIFLRETDEEHPITAGRAQKYLA